MELDLSIKAFLQQFCGADLTVTLARIESSIRGVVLIEDVSSWLSGLVVGDEDTEVAL